MNSKLNSIVDEYFDNVSSEEVINKLEALRGPCVATNYDKFF